jgi:hypothetical protein
MGKGTESQDQIGSSGGTQSDDGRQNTMIEGTKPCKKLFGGGLHVRNEGFL